MMKNIPQSSNQRVCDSPEFVERRNPASSRRKIKDRRSQEERRLDSRVATVKLHKTIKAWFRSLIRSRLGVDRRKKGDRRKNADRRQQVPGSSLTQAEIADLLS